MPSAVVGRFAPSPSGYLHLGNLLSMLLAWLDCRSRKGELVFRMEDLDPARSKPIYAEAITEDLRWLGLDWDRGWPKADYAQSRRRDDYEDAFSALQRMELVYPCWCSRAERLAAASAPQEGEAVHDRSCRCSRLSRRERDALLLSGRKPAWKLRSPDQTLSVEDGHYGLILQNPARELGDCIIRRSDGVFAYQLAVCVDDALMGVNRVVRGRDLLQFAPLQSWLISTLGGEAPAYCHGPLILGSRGKLSKRQGSLSTQYLRRELSPEAVLGALAHGAGLTADGEAISARELLSGFSWDLVRREDIPESQVDLGNR